eukprot:925408_1
MACTDCTWFGIELSKHYSHSSFRLEIIAITITEATLHRIQSFGGNINTNSNNNNMAASGASNTNIGNQYTQNNSTQCTQWQYIAIRTSILCETHAIHFANHSSIIPPS